VVVTRSKSSAGASACTLQPPVARAPRLPRGSAGASPSLVASLPRCLVASRRGSVLVLVMTLLGILFVVGVAFLATMNFESDMISAERIRSQSDNGVAAAAEGAGAIIRNAVMSSPGVPFGDSALALSGSPFAEISGVHNTFSPIEPIRRVGPDATPYTADDTIVFNGYFDAQAHAGSASTQPSQIPGFYIDTQAPNGAQVIAYNVVVPGIGGAPPIVQTINLLRCKDGPLKGQACTVPADCQTTSGPPLYTCEGQGLADADGDGIVDSLLVDAKEMGLSSAQLADLAARVNPASNLAGKVSVALRVVPHGGMVNLNESHPTLIQNIFDLPSWPAYGAPADPAWGSFLHGPTQRRTPYSSVLEELQLRRRNNLPPRQFQPSMLHGNPIPTGANSPDMAWMLFWRDWTGGPSSFQNSLDGSHRFSPFGPNEFVTAFSPDVPYWPAMMDPATADFASAGAPHPYNPAGTAMVYDKRHLVTTASIDETFARTSMATTPLGKKDLRQVMHEANWTNFDPDMCLPLMPFEYVNYPTTLEEETDRANYSKTCCPDDPSCEHESTRGRLQLSLPWIDEQLVAANDPKWGGAQQNEYRERIYHIIHDVFFMLVRNATQATEVEGMLCESDRDCPIMDTGCLLNGGAVPPGGKGFCVHGGNAAPALFTNPNAPAGPGCLSSPCAIPGSICRSDGVCTLTAPAWRDVVCPATACDASEFCLIETGAVTGVCADLWTRTRRSEALVARTAASLTANMIDFVDADNVPTRVAIRNFEFVTKCNGGTNHNLPCASPADCGGSACMNLTGRDIDLDPAAVGVQGVYVYGLERQPYITEVATLVAPGGPPAAIEARAVEIFNPEQLSIPANDVSNQDQYFLYELDTGGALTGAHVVTLTNNFRGNDGTAPGPFTTYYWEAQPGKAVPMMTPPNGTPYEITGPNGLTFENGWTIYLVRRVQFGSDPPVDVVIDQFNVVGNDIAKDDPNTPCDVAQNPDGCFNSLERLVRQAVPWTATVPWTGAESNNAATLGTWNGVVNGAIHPVEIVFPNTGTFGVTTDTTKFASFPTTGTLSLLMRHSGRAITDFTSPPVGAFIGKAIKLAFNTDFAGASPASALMLNPPGGGTYEPKSDILIQHVEQVDNGRIPLFDAGTKSPAPWGRHYAHHLPPSLFKPWDPTGTNPNGTDKALPGDLNTLPWGQLLFDYFTALPLSNGGPYDLDPDGIPLSLPDLPRVDQGGLRVHGRININAAPWKVLSGLPLVPLNNIPPAFQAKIAAALPSPDPAVAQPIGPELAQAIASYRDARAITDPAGANATGNYDDGSPPFGPAGNVETYGRGWTNPSPMVRRGTGFMSLGELANVRHGGAAVVGGLPPSSPFRVDSDQIDLDNANNNNQDFISAAAVLIALGDWVSVRSHVFTVYGQIRGADDPLITDPNQQRLDTDARAIRFQETIDRLPVLQGRPRPQRIGERTVGRYTDVNND
jgi:hypothetical protein